MEQQWVVLVRRDKLPRLRLHEVGGQRVHLQRIVHARPRDFGYAACAATVHHVRAQRGSKVAFRRRRARHWRGADHGRAADAPDAVHHLRRARLQRGPRPPLRVLHARVSQIVARCHDGVVVLLHMRDELVELRVLHRREVAPHVKRILEQSKAQQRRCGGEERALRAQGRGFHAVRRDRRLAPALVERELARARVQADDRGKEQRDAGCGLHTARGL